MDAIEIQEQIPVGDDAPYQPVLKVVGLGGGGCNAIARMMELGLGGLQFIAANTDHQALLDPIQRTSKFSLAQDHTRVGSRQQTGYR